MTFSIPRSWTDPTIWLIWDVGGAESLVFSALGQPLQGLTGGKDGNRRVEFPISSYPKGVSHTLYVEMACNGLFGVGGPFTDIAPPEPNRTFTLDEARLVVPDELAWGLWYDFEIISGLARQLPADSDRGNKALWVGNKMMNLFRREDRKTWEAAREAGKEILDAKNGPGGHKLTAIGHCHIEWVSLIQRRIIMELNDTCFDRLVLRASGLSAMV